MDYEVGEFGFAGFGGTHKVHNGTAHGHNASGGEFPVVLQQGLVGEVGTVLVLGVGLLDSSWHRVVELGQVVVTVECPKLGVPVGLHCLYQGCPTCVTNLVVCGGCVCDV